MREGWTYKKLGNLYPIIMGKTPPRGVASMWDTQKETNNLWVSIADLSKNEGKEIFETKEQISDEGSQNIRLIPKGALLLSFKLTLGKMAFAGKDLYTNEAIISLFDNDNFDLKYLYYYFSSLNWSELASGNEKVKGKTLNKKSLGAIPVATIPLSEQKAIVSRLDSAFAKIDALKANAKKQLDDAKALFQKALEKAMEPKEGWAEKTLGEIADIKGGKRVPKGYKLESSDTGYKYIRVADFTDEGTVDESNIQFISKEVFEQIKRYTITDKDVYISIAGTIGKSGIIPSSLNGANLTENACKLVFTKPVNKRYVYLFTKSDIFVSQIEKATKQASQPKLALTRLAEVKMPIPPLSEQKAIVAQLDQLSEKVKRLQEIQEKTIKECDALKQAILRKVFE